MPTPTRASTTTSSTSRPGSARARSLERIALAERVVRILDGCGALPCAVPLPLPHPLRRRFRAWFGAPSQEVGPTFALIYSGDASIATLRQTATGAIVLLLHFDLRETLARLDDLRIRVRRGTVTLP